MRHHYAVIAIAGSLAALGGTVFAVVLGGLAADGGEVDLFRAVGRGVWSGLIISVPITAAELLYINGPGGLWVRRRGFAAGLLLRSLFYFLVIVAGIWSGAALFGRPDAIGFNAETYTQLLFAATIALVANFLFSVDRLLGRAVFVKFLTGRYSNPVEERHILLFADLTGSTALAERIGDLAFHRYLNALFHDLGGVVATHGGSIHKYVGDEVIASWPDRPRFRTKAVTCALDMRDVLQRRAAHYERDFGFPPQIRIGVHAGPVVVGEMGDVRREIVFLGDAMNTAARIVDMCRTHDRPLLVSDDALDGAPLEGVIQKEPIGGIQVRGRKKPIYLSAVSRGG